jgi:hypothetical protein
MSGSDASSGSSNGDCPLVGEDSSDDSSQYSTGSSNTDGGSVPPSQASWSAYVGVFGTLLRRVVASAWTKDAGGPTTLPFRIHTVTALPSVTPVRMRRCPGWKMLYLLSDKGWGRNMQLCRHGLLTSLPLWTGPEDFSLLQLYVRTHFSGDWAAYTAFVHWADSQRLEFPGEPVHIETWLLMKTPSIGSGDPPGAPLAASAMKGGGLGNLGNSNMCNKTCIDLSVARHILPSSGAPPRTSAPGRILFLTGSSGNHDIRSFLASRNLTPTGRLWHSQSTRPLLSKRLTRPPSRPLGCSKKGPQGKN